MFNLKQLFCKHNHFIREREQDNDGIISHFLVCTNCWKEFPISTALTHASGVFAHINDRLESESDYKHLLQLAEEYQAEKYKNRS